ncbi:MAG: STAS domain-containing protein [Betaproteobacteria bacterium]
MELKPESVGGVAVVAIVGRVDSTTAPDLARALESPVSGPAPRLILDLTATEYVSSAGLRVLLRTAKLIEAAGGKFALHSVNDRVREVLDISGFLAILTVCAGREEALVRTAA